MSTFDHIGLIKDINTNLAPLRKAQPDAMQAFGQLAGAAMKEGVVSAKFLLSARNLAKGEWVLYDDVEVTRIGPE